MIEEEKIVHNSRYQTLSEPKNLRELINLEQSSKNKMPHIAPITMLVEKTPNANNKLLLASYNLQ